MASTKLKMGLVAAVITASVLTPWLLQRQAQARLNAQNEIERRQYNQLAELAADNQRLAGLIASADRSRASSNSQFRELLKLRGENHCPTSLDQLTPYLAQNNATLSGSNQYEIIYQGSLDQLKNLPWGSIAVVRDAQPWAGPNGTMLRTYGFPSGSSQMVIDNLQPWLSQHVITPPMDAPGH